MMKQIHPPPVRAAHDGPGGRSALSNHLRGAQRVQVVHSIPFPSGKRSSGLGWAKRENLAL